jgi:hypothetical protein
MLVREHLLRHLIRRHVIVVEYRRELLLHPAPRVTAK